MRHLEMSKTLEGRISEALKSDITVAEVANLIIEVKKALADAEQNAVAVRKAAIDPIAFPDTVKAHAATEMATFTVDRWRATQSRLIQRYSEVEASEALARWTAEAARVEKRRDAAAAKFLQCHDLIERLTAAYAEVQEVEEECSAVNRASPPGQRHIQGPELTARRLAAFSSSDPSVLKATVLFWSGKQIWPPRQPSIALSMIPPPMHDPKYSTDWHAARSGTAAPQPDKLTPEAQRIADFYEAETRQQNQRRAREDAEDRAARVGAKRSA
jgi:hypothetical protein